MTFYCDFCHAEDPKQMLPIRGFNTPLLSPAATSTPWAACEACAPLIESDQWNRLAQRVTDAQLSDSEQPPDPKVHDLILTQNKKAFRQLRKHIAGSLQPFVAPSNN